MSAKQGFSGIVYHVEGKLPPPFEDGRTKGQQLIPCEFPNSRESIPCSAKAAESFYALYAFPMPGPFRGRTREKALYRSVFALGKQQTYEIVQRFLFSKMGRIRAESSKRA